MAKEKTKKSEGYVKQSGSGKVIGFFAAIVLIAIIVVAIVLSIPPKMDELRTGLGKISTSSFMQTDESMTDFKDAQSKIGENVTIEYYVDEMEEVIKVTTTVNDVVEYYNKYYMFAQENDFLKDNFKTIKNAINKIAASSENLDKIIDEMNLYNSTANTHLQGKYIEFRKEYLVWLDANRTMISCLSDVFGECLEDKFVNNAASRLVLDGVNIYMDNIVEGFKKLAEEDKLVGGEQYTNSTYNEDVDKFASFVSDYVTDESFVRSYVTDDDNAGKTYEDNFKKDSITSIASSLFEEVKSAFGEEL